MVDSDKMPEPTETLEGRSGIASTPTGSTPADPSAGTTSRPSAPAPTRLAPRPGEKAATPPRIHEAPPARDLADKTALLLIDVGTPANANDVKAFLRRLYADHRIFDSPLGAFGRRLFTTLFRPTASKHLKAAVEAVGGRPPESEALGLFASTLCDRLDACEGLPAFTPFIAFQYSRPSIEEMIADIRGRDFTQIVALWSRPFPSRICASIREVLLRCGEVDGTPPIAFIESWLDEERVAPCLGALVREGLSELPEALRKEAHVCFALQAFPIEGDRDPALARARSLAKAALDGAGLANDHTVVYLDALEPRAPLAPAFSDLFGRLAGARPPLLAVPLNHLVEGLSTRAELDLTVAAEAARRGFRHFARTPTLATRPEILAAIEAALLRHLSLANTFRAETAVAAGR